MLKYLKNIIIPQSAKPLLLENKLVNKAVSRKKLIELKSKSKKIFYIINRKPSATGLFSNFAFVLNHIKYAKKKNFIPVVDMQNFPTIYNEKKKVLNTLNSWEYYFEKLNKYKLKNIYKNEYYIFSSQFFLKNMELELDKFKKNSEMKQIFKKYIRIKKKHINKVNFYIKKKFKKNKILGILIRGTTQKITTKHQMPVEPSQLIPMINKVVKNENCNKIFLVTEDLKYFNLIKKVYKNKIIFNKSFRANVNFYQNHAEIFNVYPRNLHRYKLGKEILIDTLMLSNCDVLLYSDSNVSRAAILFSKKKQKKYFIQTENNSSNIFIARWKWYIKTFLSGYLFGIKYKLIKKNY